MLRVSSNCLSDLINVVEVSGRYREIALGTSILFLCCSLLLISGDIMPLASILILVLEQVLEFGLSHLRLFECHNLQLCLIKLVGKLSQILVPLLYSLKLLKVSWVTLFSLHLV